MNVFGLKWKEKPLTLSTPQMLDNLMSTGDNAVVLFYSNHCDVCSEFKPIFYSLADDIHRSNAVKGARPIIVAEVDAESMKQDIEDMRPGFLQFYPTLLLKRWDGKGLIWDPEVPMTRDNISRVMSAFFEDPNLTPIDESLHQIMDDDNPDFIYYYMDGIKPIPRFTSPINPNFTDIRSAMQSSTQFFLENPDARLGGKAFPVDLFDRPDIQIPMIYDVKEDRSYPMRDSHRWIKDRFGI